MPTRLLLEGGDLQELLAQVREEHGARAKIVSAERVRAGGLTGLLRAERYELTVELPDDESADAPVPVGAAVGAGVAQQAVAAVPAAVPRAASAVGPASDSGGGPVRGFVRGSGGGGSNSGTGGGSGCGGGCGSGGSGGGRRPRWRLWRVRRPGASTETRQPRAGTACPATAGGNALASTGTETRKLAAVR